METATLNGGKASFSPRVVLVYFVMTIDEVIVTIRQ